MHKPIWIAIDGPAGSGKSTIAKQLTEKLKHFLYINTGAMYRALAYYFLQNKINYKNELERISALNKFQITLDGEKVFLLSGKNTEEITNFIYNENIAKITSQISTYIDVRQKLVSDQQSIAQNKNVIMDGRDVGTIVLPDAQIKIYLDASIDKRAQRRVDQLNDNSNFELIKQEISDRDYTDMHRPVGALICPKDADIINTDNLTIEECTNLIYEKVKPFLN